MISNSFEAPDHPSVLSLPIEVSGCLKLSKIQQRGVASQIVFA
jgi:hypothetical protein